VDLLSIKYRFHTDGVACTKPVILMLFVEKLVDK